METTFELNDTLYAKAEVPPTEEVYIWLGANVMLAYPMDEAETLLAERLSKAKKSLEDCEEDLEFLREQITVSRHSIPSFVSLLPSLPSLPSFWTAPWSLSGYHILTSARPWRLRQPEYTTGTLYRSGKTRVKKRGKIRRQSSPVAETAIRDEGSNTEGFIVGHHDRFS